MRSRRSAQTRNAIALLVGAACCLLGSVNAAAAVPAPPLGYLVDLSNTVTIFNTATNTVSGAINPPLAAGFSGVAVSPDASRLYLADGNHTIAVVHSPANQPTFDTVTWTNRSPRSAWW